jgi:acyl dehydratase
VTLLHWEDFSPGQVTDCGSRLVTREEIVAFAAEYDPQPMHLDEDAAREGLMGGLVASGWHSCCILMRMLSDNILGQATFLGAPGVDEVRWLAPIRPGDRIKARASVLETRASRSRPEMGFVKFRFELVDPTDKPLLTLLVSPMFARRFPERAAPATPDLIRGSGQRGNFTAGAHSSASEDARERADDTRPEAGSSAHAALATPDLIRGSGQRGNSKEVRAHSASEDARERADDTRPEAGSSARRVSEQP